MCRTNIVCVTVMLKDFFNCIIYVCFFVGLCSGFCRILGKDFACKIYLGPSVTMALAVILLLFMINEPVHEISNNVVCVTSKTSDQPAHTHNLIRTFASRLSIL